MVSDMGLQKRVEMNYVAADLMWARRVIGDISVAGDRGPYLSLSTFPHLSLIIWPSPVLTDIHDRAAKSRKDVQNGDHGREEETATAVVLR
jgi:hypothetical protein